MVSLISSFVKSAFVGSPFVGVLGGDCISAIKASIVVVLIVGVCLCSSTFSRVGLVGVVGFVVFQGERLSDSSGSFWSVLSTVVGVSLGVSVLVERLESVSESVCCRAPNFLMNLVW